MRTDRDGLLDGWAEQSQRLARLEANLILAVDLLTEWVDERLHENPAERVRLRTATRSFVLNVPVGGR